MSVSVKYKGNEIAKLSESGQKTLLTEGKYCDANIVVENTDVAVQPALTQSITANGTTTITPSAPYDALSSVQVEVNVPSSGGAGYSVTFPETITGDLTSSYYYDFIRADGTVMHYTDYAEIAGKTLSHIVCFNFYSDDNYWVWKGSVSSGTIVDFFSVIHTAYLITPGNSTFTSMAAGSYIFHFPVADTVFESCEWYYTD